MCLHLMFLYAIWCGFLGLTRLLTSLGRLLEARGVMICDVMLMLFNLDFFKPNHGNAMACSMLCVVYWFLLLSSFLVWSWGVYLWDTWPNHFWVIDQLDLDYFPVTLMGLKCWFILDDVMLWHVLTWPFWSLRSVLFTLRCFLVARWEPMDIVIYFGILYGCSLRTDGYCDLSLMPSVADRELLWLLFDVFQLLMENWCDYCGLSFGVF